MAKSSYLQMLSSLANQDRLDILTCLHQEEMCVNTLVQRTALSQHTLSRHLHQLLNAGLVTMRADGKFHLFTIHERNAAPFLSLFTDHPIVAQLTLVRSELMYVWNIQTNEQHWLGDVDAAMRCEPDTFPRTVDAWEARIHPNDLQRVMSAAERHLLDGSPFFERYRIMRTDGTYAVWTDCGSAMRDASGQPYKWIGMTREISPSLNA